MNKLYVYADFHWLDAPALIGELSFDIIRGKDVYGFSFSKEWLSLYGDIRISEDLNNYPGIQYRATGEDIFSCFSDTLPDRWGRTLLNRRERLTALEEKRPVRRLSSFDYLIGIDDLSRMGGFRFSEILGGEFINSSLNYKVPPLTSLRELMFAAHQIEASEETHTLPEKKWINQLLQPGTSLGGARPKASVVDESGNLTVAKFPSRKDEYDVSLWEHLSHILGKKAGLNVAETRVIMGNRYHVLLSKRFDRTSTGKRIHFASALTLLGLTDGDNASTGHGYLDIVDFIVRYGNNVEKNLEELFRRVAFYIIIGNSDDHFRNHGFLLGEKGWELSPAYDINPTLSDFQSLLINSETNEADLGILLNSSSDYMLKKDKAKEIIEEVKKAFILWHEEARKLGIYQQDIDMFSSRINATLSKTYS